jgi:putative cell wall-binding protein
MPATRINAESARRFPYRRARNDRCRSCFPDENKEFAMAERRKKSTRKTRKTSAKKTTSKRWSQRVTRESDSLDLKQGVFKQTSAKKIAASLKRSAERSTRRKSGAYRSALSMLVFYMNRAGNTLPKTQRQRLERAKVELKHQFGRE